MIMNSWRKNKIFLLLIDREMFDCSPAGLWWKTYVEYTLFFQPHMFWNDRWSSYDKVWPQFLVRLLNWSFHFSSLFWCNVFMWSWFWRFVFSYKCIRQSLEDSNRCPKCNYIIDNVDQLYPNFLGECTLDNFVHWGVLQHITRSILSVFKWDASEVSTLTLGCFVFLFLLCCSKRANPQAKTEIWREEAKTGPPCVFLCCSA